MRGLLFKRVILVFQMGKVGSLSALYAIHRSLGYLEKQNRWRRLWDSKEIGNTIIFHMHRYNDFNDFRGPMILWRARLGLPLKVVCPIREPIARDVSAFFYFYLYLYVRRKGFRGLLTDANLRELEELFLRDTRPLRPRRKIRNYILAEHQFPLNWFDRHFRPLTRIDVYKEPFPIDRKWQIYRRGFTQVLVYRIDLKRSEQEKLISSFLGIKLDKIVPENAAGDGNYAEHYSRFRESVKLPEHYIGRMHDSRFAKHFWSPAELKSAADKWRVAPSN